MARNGKRWSAEEEAYLRGAVGGASLSDMAAQLERSAGAVRCRLLHFAVLEGGGAAACERFGVTPEQVRDFTQRQEAEARAKADAAKTAAAAPPPSSGSKKRPAEEAAVLAAVLAATRLQLTPSQQRALEAVQAGGHVCITGPAGTGKSTLLARVLAWAADAGRAVGVTAMTGCAALVIGGRTLHSFLGIGLAAKTAQELADVTRIKFRSTAIKLRALDMLVVDEISMADAELLDKVSRYLQLLRGNDAPFGGVQMLLIGDFCQLPPVSRGGGARFAFQAPEWLRAAPAVVVLAENVRQQADPAFAAMLDRLRWGKCGKADLAALQACKGRVFPDGIKPTVLYALNRDVERVNQAGLQALKDDLAKTFVLRIACSGRDRARALAFAKSSDIPEELELAVGAQVMVTANADPDAGIVNGTRAVIEDYIPAPERVALRLVNGRRYFMMRHKVQLDASKDAVDDAAPAVSYFPLKLAYALSAHRAQAATLDAVELDLGLSIFEYAQAYVALSRARSLDCVRVTDVHPASFKAHPAAVDFYRQHAHM